MSCGSDLTLLDERWLKEIDRLNMLPFNQRAAQMLKGVGERPQQCSLHSVRLALWALRSGQTEVEAAVSETLEAMPSWSPERLAQFLELPEDARDYGPPGCMEADTPLALASVILDDIEARMLLRFPWYHDLT